jgi:phosphatidylinositol alpha-1,6-mannosyltransferase
MTGGARVLLAAQSLVAGNGGICRVARLMANVLTDLWGSDRLAADGLTLGDDGPPPDVALPVRAVRDSRPRFVLACHRAARTHTHYLYDFLGMARAHPRLPGFRRPALCYVHGIEVWEGTPANRIAAARRMTRLVANSTYTRDRADRTHGGFARAPVCWLATETDEPAAVRTRRSGPPTVLIVARTDELAYKGHRELIDSWPRVVGAVPDARLVVVGTGPGLESLRARAAATPVADRIEFRGFVPEDRMPAIWAECTLFAMPSRGEGFGLVYIEAMRHGLPVVASIHDAAPEVNLDGVTGYNVNLDRPDELGDRIVHVLQDEGLAARLGEAGRRRWAEHFRFSAFRDRFRPILTDFLGRG